VELSETMCGLRDIAPLCLQVAIAVLLEAAHEYISVSTPLSARASRAILYSFAEVHEGEGGFIHREECGVVLLIVF
jgi:hypothetical protein